jgi:3-isopropylmalate/(R)-2-methylmalate dehydratase large subunit
LRYLRQEAGIQAGPQPFGPDPDAAYDEVVELDAAMLAPQIAFPHTVDNVRPIEAAEGIAIQQIVIGSCTNGRLDDLEAARRILAGKKVARNVRMLVFPASFRIYAQALEQGIIADLVRAGAVVMDPAAGRPGVRRRLAGWRQGLGDNQPQLEAAWALNGGLPVLTAVAMPAP